MQTKVKFGAWMLGHPSADAGSYFDGARLLSAVGGPRS
jgi:hypothetical protein